MGRVLKEHQVNDVTFFYDEKYKDHLKAFEVAVYEADTLIPDKSNIDKYLVIDNENIGGCTVHIYTKTCALFNCGMMFNYEFDNAIMLGNKLADRYNETRAFSQPKEQYIGTFETIGKRIAFNRTYGSYRFTDEECNALLRGETISFVTTSQKGNNVRMKGALTRQENDGYEFYGFAITEKAVPYQFAQHVFTDEEVKALEAGESLEIDALVKGHRKIIDVKFDRRDGITVLNWDVRYD